MNKQVKTTPRNESEKKLRIFTLLTTLVIACIVFSSVLLLNGCNKLRLLDQYVSEVPVIVQEREKELARRTPVFGDDVVARGMLGVRLYKEEGGLAETERLEKIRRMISAVSVTLTDESGTVLNTTGPMMPSELFGTRVRTLEPQSPAFELYPVSPADDGAPEAFDGTALVMFPAEAASGRRLVFEFSCTPLLDIYNTLGSWSGILDRTFAGLDTYAFIRTGSGELSGYPFTDLTNEARERLNKEVSAFFGKRSSFLPLGKKNSFQLVSLQNQTVLAVLSSYPEMDVDILLAIPFRNFISSGVYCALTLSVFIVFSLILFSLYVSKLLVQKRGYEDPEEFRRNRFRAARSGRNLLLAAIVCFSVMLLMLENNATIAYVGTTKRVSLQHEVSWHEKQRKAIRSSYTDLYKARSQALAEFLTDHKEYRTRSDLQVLSDMVRADYLMLFDKAGREILSSNSYTGFSVNGPGANLSDEYRAVLLGYPFAVAGPEEDPYTKKQQIGTAVLLTKETGEADGFLLAVFDAEAMNAELENESLEHTVSTFAVAEGNEAAVIRNEDGVFLAHTDAKKTGSKAEYYITSEAYGEDYEGFTEYDGKSMYVSGVSTGENSLLFMVPDRAVNKYGIAALLAMAVVLLIIRFLYCPKASELCARAVHEAAENHALKEEASEAKHPLSVFTSGYAFFLTLLAGIAMLAAFTLEWPAFTFVFGGLWSRGVHLFSLWAALFFTSVSLFGALLLRMVLKGAEVRANPRVRTILKLADSSVSYAVGSFILFGILYMFGVNTTALLASAGIVSIAVGMGAKDMAADILAGLFIATEDSLHMGDVVTVGSWKGRVTDLGIRTIEITDDSQNVKILNNSHVSDIVNMSRQKTACVLELPLERHAGMTAAEAILRKAVEAASKEMPELYGSLKLEGIYNISREGFTARLSYSCAEAARDSVAKRLPAFLEKEVRQEMEKVSGT